MPFYFKGFRVGKVLVFRFSFGSEMSFLFDLRNRAVWLADAGVTRWKPSIFIAAKRSDEFACSVSMNCRENAHNPALCLFFVLNISFYGVRNRFKRLCLSEQKMIQGFVSWSIHCKEKSCSFANIGHCFDSLAWQRRHSWNSPPRLHFFYTLMTLCATYGSRLI